MRGGGGVVNLFILGPGIVCFVCVCARASKLLWKVPDPWQEAPARLFPKLWAELEVKGEVPGKQVNPLCKCSLGESEHLAVERGRRAPGVRRRRSPREPRWLSCGL